MPPKAFRWLRKLLGRDDGLPGENDAGRALGSGGERYAARVLTERGYEVVEANYRCRSGEIDIVALDGETVVFVEVKTRRSVAKGRPEEAVDPRKRRHMVAAAVHFVKARRLPKGFTYRFDVVALTRQPDGSWQAEVMANAFTLDEIGMGNRVLI